MQLREHFEDGHYYSCNIPNAECDVMSSVKWGSVSTPFTPAYWKFLCIVNGSINDRSRYKLGRTLKQEVVACLLGGHGVSGELGIAAYHHLLKNGVIEGDSSVNNIEELLKQPLIVGSKKIKYRYPSQKAKYISSAIELLNTNQPPNNDARALRNWLISLPGIGYKTASWVVRNWLDDDEVAILDIHIHRAGVIAGIFSASENVSKDYLSMEERYIAFSKGIGVPASILDNQIWNEMRKTPGIVRHMLIELGVNKDDRCGLPPSNNRSTTRNYSLFAAT